jgi:SAM-dependent methyltransferase
MTSHDVWLAHLSDEVRFWDDWMRTKGLEWPESYREVLTLDRPLQEEYRALLPDGPVKILDVGSGPFTQVGTRWEGRDVTVVAVDPLADEYARLRAYYKLVGPVETERCAGEALGSSFANASFDLAVAQNSLDHSYDPLAVIANMLAVVKPGCAVRLKHTIREAERCHFAGLHQWNFYPEDGRFIIEGHGSRVDVSERLGVSVAVSDCDWPGWFVAILIKAA